MPRGRLLIHEPAKRGWILLFLLISLLLLAVGYWFLRTEMQNFSEDKFLDLAAIAELKVNQIDEWRKERLGDATNLSESPLFIRALKDWLSERRNVGLRATIRKRLELTKKAYDYADILLVDEEGHILLSLQEESEPLSDPTRQAMAESIATRKAVLFELFPARAGAIFLDSLAPVVDEEGRFLAVLILRSDARAFLYPFIQSWPAPTRTAETLLVKKEGEEVVFLNDLRHRAQTALSLRYPLSQTSLPAVQAVLGKEGRFEGRDYRGEKVLAHLLPVPDSNWFLIAKEDQSEILAEVRYRGAKTLVIVGLLILIGGGFASIGYRRQRARFFQSLYLAEKKKREAEEELRTTLYSIGDAVITTDRAGMVRIMNPVAERLTGWSEAEARGKPLAEVFHIINEQTRRQVENPVQRVLREGIVVGLANHTVLIARDGREIPIADAGAPIRDDKGAIHGVVLVFRDQTQERAALEALRESEEKYRAVVENSHAGILIVGEDYKFLYVNQTLCEMLGRHQEEILGHDFREFLDEESRALVADRYVRRQRGEEVPPRYEFNVVRKDGEKRRVEISSTIVKDSKGRVKTVAQILDITERKRAEEALRENEEKYRILHEFAGEAIFTYTVDLRLMEINKAACDYIGHPREELLGRNIFEVDILHPEDMGRASENLGRILSREKRLVVDKLRFKGKHGLYGTFQVTSTPVLRNDEVIAITNVCRDVTIEERLYSVLEASERRYRFLFNAGNDAIFVYALTEEMRPGKFTEVNDLASTLSGYSRAELLERSPVDLVLPEEKDKVLESIRLISEKKHRVFERTLLTKEGRRIPCEISSHFFELNGIPTILAIARDITERKKAEESLRAALREKDVMLREIHHRVKNNMQIMSSLLRLQARQVSDERAQEAFRESQTRIRSMAMIHEKLYQSQDFASIDFADYIEKMVTHLYVVYQVDPKRVRFLKDVHPVGLDINRAIPCGLIVNELVSNALKYAFPAGKKGELTVKMFRDEKGKLHLLVKDTGIGFPDHIDIHQAHTLGLQIVSDLTKQLEGTLELRRDGGSEFEIVF